MAVILVISPSSSSVALTYSKGLKTSPVFIIIFPSTILGDSTNEITGAVFTVNLSLLLFTISEPLTCLLVPSII